VQLDALEGAAKRDGPCFVPHRTLFCIPGGAVHIMNLSTQNVHGQIPPEVSLLSALECLDIVHLELGDQLHGPIPTAIALLSNLSRCDLHGFLDLSSALSLPGLTTNLTVIKSEDMFQFNLSPVFEMSVYSNSSAIQNSSLKCNLHTNKYECDGDCWTDD
jgi:hypothetical protein